jgi:hypothetical protein
MPTDRSASPPLYTALWQDADPSEARWIQTLFGSVLGDSLYDGRRNLAPDHVILFDHFVTFQDPAYYARFRGRDAFLVDLSDENYDFSPDIYANFRGVLRMYWSSVFRPEAVMFLPLGFSRLPASTEAIRKATERQYVWSFLGQVNKSSRPEMAYALLTVQPHLLFATDRVDRLTMWNRGPNGPRRYPAPQTSAILRDSIFAPCPMGNVNLECYRVYEALESGTIPIVEKRLTLDYFRKLWGEHPVPTVSSWSAARTLIARLFESPAELDLLQERCMSWWRQYKQRYPQTLQAFLARRSAATQLLTPADIVYPSHARPGWKIMELLRHHDRHALQRRVTRQVQRLRSTGKLRVAHTGNRAR